MSLRLGSQEPKPITTTLGYRGGGIYQPVWSRDGSRIFYMRDNTLGAIMLRESGPEKVLGPLPEDKNLFGYYGFSTFNAEGSHLTGVW